MILSFRGPATPPPDDYASGCRAEESAVGSREAGRGSPRRLEKGEVRYRFVMDMREA